MRPSTDPILARFNTADDTAARAVLREVCASEEWCGAILARRPYPDPETLLGASDAATARLGAEELAAAVAGHSPLGRPAPGDSASAREQRGMADASERVRAETAELDRAYRRRFGHVFLICADGLSGEQLRDAVRARIGNTPERENEIVRAELGRINRVRLTRLVTEGALRP
ncbi:2-oxo-4-hydroxy-4-carboxy-5-ureidoimidazoline decarboxylase [Streptomyces sp. NPDC050617]|uniref:2-oxo-4-hydroxy-4-carboxy-5-ureidoimidazoline decarboxylase n=1 Tax=Streptomyces sp. NPDC050617 TaxID=3154628 RepID=UPI0034417E8A